MTGEGLMRVEAESCTIQPLRMGGTPAASWNTIAMETVVNGLNNGNADVIVHKATNHRVRFVSDFSIGESSLQTTASASGPQEVISRHNE